MTSDPDLLSAGPARSPASDRHRRETTPGRGRGTVHPPGAGAAQAPYKATPAYGVTSVDNALRLAVVLQLEGPLSVTQAADRLGVSASTAHRLLTLLVYRDFATQAADRTYRVGPLLELPAYSPASTVRLRAAGLPHLARLVGQLEESVSLIVRTGTRVRFIAAVEPRRTPCVASREGMVFPAHRTSAGLLLLADLGWPDVHRLYTEHGRAATASSASAAPDLGALRADLALARRNGFALNTGNAEKGVTALGVPVRGADGTVVAGLSVSMPSFRWAPERLPHMLAVLRSSSRALTQELA